jgi:hypothetical protein
MALLLHVLHVLMDILPTQVARHHVRDVQSDIIRLMEQLVRHVLGDTSRKTLLYALNAFPDSFRREAIALHV